MAIFSPTEITDNYMRASVGKAASPAWRLFLLAEGTARQLGAEALYISAHSAVESQAFYKAMGCVEAAEYDPHHTAKEPCDCQLECRL